MKNFRFLVWNRVVYCLAAAWLGWGSAGWLIAQEDFPLAPRRTITLGGEPDHQLEQVRATIQILQAKADEMATEIETLRVRAEQLNQQRMELIAEQDSLKVSAASFDEILRLLQTQRVASIIDLAGLEARRAALLELSKASPQQEQYHQQILERIHLIVRSQREKLAQAEQLAESGALSSSEIAQARRELFEAEIRLAEAESKGHDSEADERIVEINLETAATAARLATIERLLNEYGAGRMVVEKVARLELDRKSVDERLAFLANSKDRNAVTLNEHLHLMELLKRRQKQIEDELNKKDQ